MELSLVNKLKLIGEILGARRGTGEADLSPFRRYRIKDWYEYFCRPVHESVEA